MCQKKKDLDEKPYYRQPQTPYFAIIVLYFNSHVAICAKRTCQNMRLCLEVCVHPVGIDDSEWMIVAHLVTVAKLIYIVDRKEKIVHIIWFNHKFKGLGLLMKQTKKKNENKKKEKRWGKRWVTVHLISGPEFKAVNRAGIIISKAQIKLFFSSHCIEGWLFLWTYI